MPQINRILNAAVQGAVSRGRDFCRCHCSKVAAIAVTAPIYVPPDTQPSRRRAITWA